MLQTIMQACNYTSAMQLHECASCFQTTQSLVGYRRATQHSKPSNILSLAYTYIIHVYTGDEEFPMPKTFSDKAGVPSCAIVFTSADVLYN